MAATSRVLQLKITLKHTRPPIWRRLLVSEDLTLAELHLILQAAMGWQNTHVHAFTIHGQRFGTPDPDDFVPVVDERKHRIGPLVRKGARFEYEYDFGDEWEHTILVEDVRAPATTETLPSCVAGRRACPPEDCGGPPGFADLLEALDAPKTRRHRDLLAWIGGHFDASRFELAEVNEALAALVRPRRPRSKVKPSKPMRHAPKPTLH
jgi:hypothetical protein